MTTAEAPNTPRTTRQAKLRIDRFNKIAASYGWDSNAATARALGISEATISRILNGKIPPNLPFILALLDVAEDLAGFRRTFEIVHVPEEVTTP